MAFNDVQVEKQLEEVMPALFDALGAPSDRVVLQALAVQASLAASPPHFRFLGAQLLNRQGHLPMLLLPICPPLSFLPPLHKFCVLLSYLLMPLAVWATLRE